MSEESFSYYSHYWGDLLIYGELLQPVASHALWKPTSRWGLEMQKVLTSSRNLRTCHLLEGSCDHFKDIVATCLWMGGTWLVLLIQFEESQPASFKTFPEHPECKLLCDSSIFLSFYWKFLNVISEIGLSLSHSHFSVALDLEGLARNWSCRAITRG